MRKKLLLQLTGLLFVTMLHAQTSTEQLLLGGWKFYKGNANGAERADFDDSSWQDVTIPHDWAISGPFDKDIDKQVVAIEQNGERKATEKTGRTGSLPWIGEGWYRTTINVPDNYSHAELIFDGAMSEPKVYVEGKFAGYWAYGYNIFAIDITPYLPKDNEKITPGKYAVAVHLNNMEESSRWYPGAGLYRPVRLRLSQDVATRTFGIFARTTRLSDINLNGTLSKMANVTITTALRSVNKHKIKVNNALIDKSGNVVAEVENYLERNSDEVTQVITVNNPKLWSPESPTLYTLETKVYDNDKLVDIQHTNVGIRVFNFEEGGFSINNDKPTKLRGVCLHHDLGPLGSAFNKAAFRRQITLLKGIGCNAIRTSHNVPAPWQMDICDEMGMLVMAESFDMWVYPKCKNGYSRLFEQTDTQSPNADGRPWWQRDVENLVIVHRNHPSIVLWSIGNEIPEQNSRVGLKYTRLIQSLIHSLDNTRLCTQGFDQGDAAIASGVFQATDIPGFNYRLHVYDKGHQNSPSGLILGTETASTISSRGVYKFPVEEQYSKAFEDGQISSYDLENCIWSNLPDDDWMWQDKAPWVTGEFVWTGFDYLGEPTPYDDYWPSRSSYFGIFDLAGLPKDRAFLYKVHWAPEQKTLHVLPHWTFPGREGEITPVFVYTTYPEAELFINGKSQGRLKHRDVSLDDYRDNRIDVSMPWGGKSKFPDPNAPDDKNRLNRYRLRWMNVKYEPGEIKVVAYDKNGNIAEQKIVKTAGKPHHLVLEADRKTLTPTPLLNGMPQDSPDLSFVTVSVVDKDGNLCPDAANQLTFSVNGAARFNSACNGDATSTEVFTKPTMKTFHGKLVVVVEATEVTGKATLKVEGKGLKSAEIALEIRN